jgi:hypothetical protein
LAEKSGIQAFQLEAFMNIPWIKTRGAINIFNNAKDFETLLKSDNT